MKKTVLLIAFFLVTGCAGMDLQDQRNMATNSLIWGGLGAAAGCVISEATGGKCGSGLAIGGVTGGLLGAGNTPPKSYPRQNNNYYYSSPYDNSYYKEQERLRRQEHYKWLRQEQERGRNDARRDFYGR